MSKKRYNSGARRTNDNKLPAVRKAPVADVAQTVAALVELSRLTKDSYSNPGANLGVGQPNLMNLSEYPMTRITKDYYLMTSLYRNDWICKRIIDTPAEDMTRAWIKFVSQIDPDAVKKLEKTIRRLDIKERILKTLKWARLYGGAGAVMMIKGQEDMMDEPLNLDTVMPGSFCGLIVLDRWEGITPDIELVTDMNDPEFGRPEFYYIGGRQFGGNMRVHHSRILTFTGRDLPNVEEESEMYWGASEMEHVFEELNKRNTSSANIAQLLFQANLRVLKVGDLAEQLATLDPEALGEIYNVARAQNEMMSSFGVQFLDKDDSFETHAYTFTGIADVYKTFMSDIAGAAEIPATKLFGRSPEGMNSTGESDLTNYYDSIAAKQESMLRPALEKLLPVICVSTFGALPDDIDFEFNSVRSSSEAERANLAKNIVDSVLAVFNADVIDKPTAMEELRKSSSYTGLFTSITDEQIDAAKQELEMQAQQEQEEPLPDPEEGNSADQDVPQEQPQNGPQQAPPKGGASASGGAAPQKGSEGNPGGNQKG